ncbi:MAG: hypothetical protein EZS28_025216, partial [Streblomastix strix]
MLDTTAYANGNSSVVFADTTSEPAIVNAGKNRTYAQTTSLHPSSERSPKIVGTPDGDIYEGQISQAFLPPLANICSRKATNSVKRESFQVTVGESDMMQVKQRDASSSDKPYSSIIAPFNGISHNKIADQYPQLRSLNANLLDIVFGVSSYILLLHFLIHALFSHLIWGTEAQIHRHQKQMNKNKHNINLLVQLLIFSSICGIFNVSAINGITQDNGISSSTLNSASSNPFSLQNANKTDINSYMVNTSGFTQSSKQSNDDIQFYISSNGNDDSNDCFSDSPCKTINHILTIEPPIGFDRNSNRAIINLKSNTQDQTGISLDSGTNLALNIIIQSEEYIQSPAEYQKSSILTSTYSLTLFTIGNIQQLKLLGLHFDNLNPSSTATTPLISISQTDDNKNPEVTIKDCIFEQINLEANLLNHTIVKVSGGHFIVENTLIQNYEFINAQRVIELTEFGQYQVDVIKSEFKNIHQAGTTGDDGGAVIKSDQSSRRNYMVTDCIFSDICTDGNGGAINSAGQQGTTLVYRTIFTRCFGRNGGAFYANKAYSAYITIDDYCEFKDCESNSQSQDLEAQEGGGAVCIIFQIQNCELLIRNCLFDSCKGNNNKGGALRMMLTRSVSVIDGVQFKNCQGPRGGAISYVGNTNNNLNIKGSTQFTSCSSLSNPGGAIHSILNSGGTLIENTQFELCNSADSDGGSIFASVNSGTLSLNKVTFIGSSCCQPGSGGAIAIVQQNYNSRISVKESSFTNCQTLTGSSYQYGWGGAIHIEIGFEVSFITSTNFQLTELSFTNCKASGAGNNLHILSDDTSAVGNQIKTGFLLTVKDMSNLPNIISDLYTNEWYCFDYMGINISKADSGNAPFTDHEPLFISPSLTPKFNDPYLVDAEFGKDEPICGNSRLKCQTIKYILNIDQMLIDDYPSNPATINIELQTNTQLENGIMIDSNSPIGIDFKIESSEYASLRTDYIKRQIQTSSKTQSLFTISNTGRLKLFGLHFDNLNPTSNTPLILISQTDEYQNPQVTIKDCKFEQINLESISLSHSLIITSGGTLLIENTLIQNYEFINGQRVIELGQSIFYLVDIVNTEFKNINQISTSNNDGGAAIAGIQGSGVLLRMRDQCKFTDITSNGNGGAICCTGWYGSTEISNSTFIRCKGRSGGALYANKAYWASITIDNQCYFKDCESNSQNEEDSGGAIFIVIQMYGGQFYIRNSQFDGCKTNNNRGGAIWIILSQDQIGVIEEVQFLNCQGSKGGAIDIQSDISQISVIKSKFNSCSSTSGPGGAIRCLLTHNYADSSVLIENTQFDSCNSANSDGGSVFAQINHGILSLNKVKFIGSSCSQPGSGGAIAIVQQNSNSHISITESSFTNCQTLAGSSNQYGWGGAIYIFTQIPATDLSSTNFQLSQLSFTNCKASGAGNNLHIRSPNTYNIGIAIASNSLVTVKDLSDL